MDRLAPELRDLVNQSVRALGEVVQRELGKKAFQRIEDLRSAMVALRSLNRDEAYPHLKRELTKLKKLSPKDRLDLARAFTLMLELMNACENAYRSHRIAQRSIKLPEGRPESIVYVLTAHPTEARSPENIAVFHEVLQLLTTVVARKKIEFSEIEGLQLRHALEIAWRTPIIRRQKPRVRDEADHIYSTFLRDETLSTLLSCARELAPIYIRSWVGGDKDGHPGVDEKTFLQSLRLARKGLLEFCRTRLDVVNQSLSWIGHRKLLADLRTLLSLLRPLEAVGPGDMRKVLRLRKFAIRFVAAYEKEIGSAHPALVDLSQLLRIFPALVVPLEFREASDVLMADRSGKSLAIFRMLKTLSSISSGGDPRWYVRGFIVSMTSELVHLEAAADLTSKALGAIKIPVIPLFEQLEALRKSESLVADLLSSKKFKPAIRDYWNNRVEMMLGYSDSAKESGVLRSRLQVAETLYRLDQLCGKQGVTPVFFHGSGGSTDRGGGPIEEQTNWWPSGALRFYKVTVQGEMVERSFASPEITRSQIERIVQAAGNWRDATKLPFQTDLALEEFADRVAKVYKETIQSSDFLQVIAAATPYAFLSLLKIGSRPTKRTKEISVAGLRAIPWILCWTQTRALFPTWWGVGRCWANTSEVDRKKIIRSASSSPVFKTYLRALGNTLAKVRLSVWRLYLEESHLSEDLKIRFIREFNEELDRAREFVSVMSERTEALEKRAWLEESIHLRSPMIHPLNLLQILAMRDRDEALLRLTVAGISSGMMTTG